MSLMNTCVIVAYWIILSSVLQSKLLPQYDTPSTPAKVTVIKEQLVSAKVDVRPSLAAVASKIYISRRSKPNRPKVLLLCILSLCGDVELNPGPNPLDTTLYPCSICREEVTDDDAAIICDQSNLWTHSVCSNISDAEYEHLLTQDYFEWKCPICDLSTLADESMLSRCSSSDTHSESPGTHPLVSLIDNATKLKTNLKSSVVVMLPVDTTMAVMCHVLFFLLHARSWLRMPMRLLHVLPQCRHM